MEKVAKRSSVWPVKRCTYGKTKKNYQSVVAVQELHKTAVDEDDVDAAAAAAKTISCYEQVHSALQCWAEFDRRTNDYINDSKTNVAEMSVAETMKYGAKLDTTVRDKTEDGNDNDANRDRLQSEDEIDYRTDEDREDGETDDSAEAANLSGGEMQPQKAANPQTMRTAMNSE